MTKRQLNTIIRPIIHRDLTAKNILLSKDFTPKIADLGVAKILRNMKTRSQTICPGTKAYMPPETMYKAPWCHRVKIKNSIRDTKRNGDLYI